MTALVVMERSSVLIGGLFFVEKNRFCMIFRSVQPAMFLISQNVWKGDLSLSFFPE